MRICNITLQNLNSLEGKWHLDLEDPAYATAGQFLIMGPTGSGKTTLLDAISLALYGATPRFSGAACKEIISRHAWESLAEVTFETASGRYRATWAVHKANKRADGAVQNIERKITTESGKGLYSGIRECDRAIKELTGMELEQFNRSIMLAQGEFTAFLKADEKEKSDILQQLTDTTIYSELSRLAFQIKKEHDEKARDLKRDLASLNVIPEEERQKLLAERDTLNEEVARKENSKKYCNAAMQWLQTLAELEHKQIALSQKWQIYLEAKGKFGPEAARLANVRKIAPHVELFNNCENSASKLENLRRDISDQQKRLAVMTSELQAAQLTLQQKSEAVAEMEQEASEMLPFFGKIRTMDATIREKSRVVEELGKKLAAAEGRSKGLEKDLQCRLLALRQGEESLGECEAWLNAHEACGWLVENYGKLEGDARRLGEKRESIAQGRQDLDRLERSIEDARKAGEESRKKLELAVTATRKILDAMALNEQARESLLAGREMEDLQAELGRAQAERARCENLRSLEDRRKMLRNGEPCPLCGALEHPYAVNGIPEPDEWQRKCGALEETIGKIAIMQREEIQLREKLTSQQMQEQNCLGELGKSGQSLEIYLHERKTRAEKLLQEETDIREEEESFREALRKFALEPTADMEMTLRELKKLGDSWKDWSLKRERLQLECEKMKTGIAAREAELAHLATSLQELGGEKEEASAALAALHAQRQGEFGQKLVEEEEKNLLLRQKTANEQRESARVKVQEMTGALQLLKGSLENNENSARRQEGELAESRQELGAILATLQLTKEEFGRYRMDHATRESLEVRERELEREGAALARERETNEELLKEHRSQNLTEKSLETLAAEKTKLEEEVAAARDQAAIITTDLARNEEQKKRAEELGERVEKESRELQRWVNLARIIGTEDGSRFRKVAQEVTLDLLLCHANAQLSAIMKRYQLKRGKNLALEVIDGHQANAVRPVASLSGGESFIVSLALALGLSAMAGRGTLMGSLFLDEGFGTLDQETLDRAMEAMAGLRERGRLVGIISHVEALKEKIHTQIQVNPLNFGRSEIVGAGCRRVA